MTNMTGSNQSDVTNCDACPLMSDRRTFLSAAFSLGVAALGTLAAIGIPARSARALTVRLVSGRRGQDHTVTYPFPAEDGAQIDRDNGVILVRWQNVVYAFNLSCPHQNTALRWDGSDKRFQCPKHHSQYQPDGTFIKGRATRNMDRLSLQRDVTKNTVVVDIDKMYQSDKNPPDWAAAVIKLPQP
jgi:nitrite reductase/ring-hydroxylating ferredoxin subunit